MGNSAKAKGASLELLKGARLHDQNVTIHYDSSDGGRFTLVDEDGSAIAQSEHPKPLSTYAWANGVQSVRHDYDLGLVED